MMVDTAPRRDANLAELLAARARRASDGRLVLDAAGGLAVGIVSAVWQPAGWLLLVSAALCFACFGSWGILDRELHERAGAARTGRVLRLGRIVVAVVGAGAAVALLISGFARVLGTWIS